MILEAVIYLAINDFEKNVKQVPILPRPMTLLVTLYCLTIGLTYDRADHRLRGSASTVLTATSQANGRWRILTPHRIETH